MLKGLKFGLFPALSLILIVLYGWTLANCTIFIICCILSVALCLKTEEYEGRFYSLQSCLLLLLCGVISLLTLYHLYNPSTEVFSNVEHHILTFTGYQAEGDEIPLLDAADKVDEAVSDKRPIWSNERLGGKVGIRRQGDNIVLDYSLMQPLFKKSKEGNIHEVLLNPQSLPAFTKSFKLHWANGVGLRVTVDDAFRADRSLEFLMDKIKPLRKDSCRVEVEFYLNEQLASKEVGGYTRLIRRSLPLSELISDIPLPDGLDFDWSMLNGITLLRDTAFVKSEDVSHDHFRLAFTPAVLEELSALEVGERVYTPADMQELAEIRQVTLSAGDAIRIGCGLHATPYIRPMIEDGKLRAKLDAPIRRSLPVERDSLGMLQSVIITSSLEGLASSRTTSALYYPVFSEMDEEAQFHLALEYLPEETLVPLTCKLQMLSSDKALVTRGGGMVESRKLAAGDCLFLQHDSRDVTPMFVMENMRHKAPFSSRCGYLMILTVLLCAGFSLWAGRDKCEPRGEIIVWMGLIALLTYRAFIAWRTSVFPPLDGFSESRFASYLDNQYTFTFTLGAIIGLGIILILYKLLYNRLGLIFRLLDRFNVWWLLGTSLLVLSVGFVAKVISDRLAYIYFPVLSFILSEWIYQYRRHQGSIDFRWHSMRYITMLTALAVPLVTDAGFGIVFALFLFLYNALDCFYAAQDKFRTTESFEARKDLHFRMIFVFLALFALFMFFGIHVLSFIYRHYWLFFAAFTLCVGYLSYAYYQKAKSAYKHKGWIYTPLALIGLFYLAFAIWGKDYFDSHRHLQYRAEVHLKPVDEIMLENEVDSRDLERLFQAAQNRWYLGYYMEDRGMEKAQPFNYKPYDLRSHFNKGITWDTQKTDAVLGRYVLGEHSQMSVYALIALFFSLFMGIFVVVNRFEFDIKGHLFRTGRFHLLGSGIALLLACQAVMITLAVTNRFIFFGQDYPLVSQHSFLTLALTFTVLAVVSVTTLRTVQVKPSRKNQRMAEELSREDRRVAWQLIGCLGVLVVLSFVAKLTQQSVSGKNFDVADALNNARGEMAAINSTMTYFQSLNQEELSKSGMLKNLSGVEENESDDVTYKPKSLQTNYYAFINYFDSVYAMSDTLVHRAKRKVPGISPFTASLYNLYCRQLSKNNRSTDIIHLREKRNGLVEFHINNQFYLLTTPENSLNAWRGHIVPQDLVAKQSMLHIQGDMGKMTLPIKKEAQRLDSHSAFTYNYPMYFAKVANEWIVDGRDYFIVGDPLQPVMVKNGPKQYRLGNANRADHYLAVQADDYVEVVGNSRNGEKSARIYVKGDQGRYFARNMLVNGKRMMVYPMGEKFFYPYHLSQMAHKALSGSDKVKRYHNLKVSLSYTLTEELYDNLNKFDINADARSLIVADGNGHIKAMVTAKNAMKAGQTGFESVNPNDEEQISKFLDHYYLTGDVFAEERTFGDLNLAYLAPGPGSSIKPITFASVMSQACFDWSKLVLYVNAQEQHLKLSGKNNRNVYARNYTDIRRGFPSLWGDEMGVNGLTDIARYMEKSSNYYNSLMVFLGFYEGDYLTNEFHNIQRGLPSDLFKPYDKDGEYNFPAFRLTDDSRVYNFKTWVTHDGQPRHEHGALHTGFVRNFGLWDDIPTALFTEDYFQSLDLFKNGQLFDVKELSADFAFAFPHVSYLPERERITRQGTKDAIRNTTLGAYPFHVTPLKMAEMYGRLYTQNRDYTLTLNPDYQQTCRPFDRSAHYSEKEGLYEEVLSQHLFEGMAQVPVTGTARALSAQVAKLKEQGYCVYAKTGTISSVGGQESQLLALVISKGEMHGLDADKFKQKLGKTPLYVMYFLSEKGKHDYQAVSQALMTVCNSGEFRRYMNDKN